MNNNTAFTFHPDMLGDLESGRKNLGDTMPVVVYRLLEYTMREALSKRFGNDTCVEVFRDAGKIAGTHFYQLFLSEAETVGALFSKWQTTFSEMKIGIVRVESLQDSGDAVITVSEDLDCSGLPVLGSAVCHYDEGFIEGVMESFSGKNYHATEVDCWAKGDRVCRFEVKAGR